VYGGGGGGGSGGGGGGGGGGSNSIHVLWMCVPKPTHIHILLPIKIFKYWPLSLMKVAILK